MRFKAQVVIISLAPERELLLLQTNKERGEFWQNVTGSIEEGECPLKGALREVYEETGLTLGDKDVFINLHQTTHFQGRFGEEVTEHSFLLRLSEKPCTIKLDPSEHQSFLWRDIKSIGIQDYGYKSNYESFVRALELLDGPAST